VREEEREGKGERERRGESVSRAEEYVGKAAA